MSDYDPVERSTDLDSHGLAPAVEPDRCAQSGGYGMEEVKGAFPGLTRRMGWVQWNRSYKPRPIAVRRTTKIKIFILDHYG